MRRTEILTATEELTDALRATNLYDVMQEMAGMARAKGGIEINPLFLRSLNDYSIRARNFSRATIQLADIFELSELENPELWVMLVRGDDSIYVFASRIRFALAYLPKIAKLIEQSTVQTINKAIEQGNSNYKDMTLLSVTIFEQESRFSSPERLVNVLRSVSMFYEACAMLNGASPSTLSVVACDSGSDKSFDFLGLAKVMECVVKLIESLWDRVVFYKEHQFKERLDLIAKSLPIIAQISNLELAGEVPPELAEQLRRNIIEGSNKFVESGATIPQIDDRSHHDPRALMSPVQKLLAASPDGKSDEHSSPSDSSVKEPDHDSNDLDFNNLSADDQEALRRLLKKATGEAQEDVTNSSNSNRVLPLPKEVNNENSDS
jgi:hypothetical protein